MNPTLSSFRIEGLHGTRNVPVVLRDDRLVIVGENGAGKSTVVNLLYYLLTCQWGRLTGYKFKRLTAVVRGETIAIDWEQLANAYRGRHFNRELARYLSPNRRNQLVHQLSLFDELESNLNPSMLEALSLEYDIPSRVLYEWFTYRRESSAPSKDLSQLEKRLRALLTEQIVYLPTYRRIEHDLKAIFPDQGAEISALRERLSHRRDRRLGYIELVEFGMEDVKRSFIEKMTELEKAARSGLANLMGSYLRDVLQYKYEDVDVESLRGMHTRDIDKILSRIDDKTLPPTEKTRLRSIVETMQGTEASNQTRTSVIAHFLAKLIVLDKAQQDREARVYDLIRVCNNYLEGKKLVFDNIEFKLKIHPEVGTNEIELSDLSSGEKQIVSLFSHIFLSGQLHYFVIIDEPELSLSVPWQKRFLPDILATQMCTGLVAVTHSPFIFENNLDSYVYSLSEFSE